MLLKVFAFGLVLICCGLLAQELLCLGYPSIDTTQKGGESEVFIVLSYVSGGFVPHRVKLYIQKVGDHFVCRKITTLSESFLELDRECIMKVLDYLSFLPQNTVLGEPRINCDVYRITALLENRLVILTIYTPPGSPIELPDELANLLALVRETP
ncbi:hypothetical protein AS159_06210 [Thermotoga sp. Ku-13t]|uniref:hypothetical protein n=1 Tax=Thermotoga sp. Ku-13t TaxID=1755813 RepID=UPI0013EBF676|nr:hypothetical protein [Thermotoga sp. Ku-13t]KAF2957978.1 hypothetical protein AS159_06210 [Thermotoga sp. Ku-13t]